MLPTQAAPQFLLETYPLHSTVFMTAACRITHMEHNAKDWLLLLIDDIHIPSNLYSFNYTKLPLLGVASIVRQKLTQYS